MDVLSELLRVVSLKSAFFYNGEFGAPWRFQSPDSSKLAPYIYQGNGRVIVYHLMLEGRVYAEARDLRLLLRPGDIVIFPQGDPHILESGPAPFTINGEIELPRIFSCGLKQTRMGGDGEVSRLVCGYLVCEPRLSEILLAALPAVFKVNIREDAAGEWLERSIQYSISQGSRSAAGSEAVLAKLSETLFSETVRRYIAQLPSNQSGWLGGVRDPEIGKTLAIMHSRPEEPWTLAGLAREVGLSRSVLAKRFRQYLGQTPLSYLTKWRLQLGLQLLTSTSHSVSQIASNVGYESEAAFNRAFKREFGDPPARHRVKVRAEQFSSRATGT